jgi:putative (di)nucleoside polyphosphate hydrolase
MTTITVPIVSVFVLRGPAGAREILLMRRVNPPAGAWCQVAGKIEQGETAWAAALRELREETGVTADLVEIVAETKDWLPYDLPHDLVPRIWKGKYRGQEQKWFLMRYLGTDAQVNIATEHPEFSQWRWLPSDQLVAQIVPFKRAVYSEVLFRFGRYL